MSTENMSKEKREIWLEYKIEYMADVFSNYFLFFALTPFTKDRPKDLTLKEFMTIVFSTENELKTNIIGHMLRAGIAQAEIDEIFALFIPSQASENNKEESLPDLRGHGHVYGDLGVGKD